MFLPVMFISLGGMPTVDFVICPRFLGFTSSAFVIVIVLVVLGISLRVVIRLMVFIPLGMEVVPFGVTMSGKRKAVYDRMDSNARVVSFLTLSYLEDDIRREHLGKLIMDGVQTFCWACHDKDTLDDGTPDKPHCHCVVHTPFAMTRSAFAHRYAIPDRFVQIAGKGTDRDIEVEDCKGLFVYLIHGDSESKDKGKFQYPLDVIKGPWATFARNWISDRRVKTAHREEDSFLAVLDFIETSSILSLSELGRWAVSHECYASFRRNCSYFVRVLQEHNDLIRESARLKAYERQIEESNHEIIYRKDVSQHLRKINAMTYAQSVFSSAGMDSQAQRVQLQINNEQSQLQKKVDLRLIKSIMGEDAG